MKASIKLLLFSALAGISLSSCIVPVGPPGVVVCRWAHIFKPRVQGENADRALKLTAETLFLTLVDPLTEPTPENQRMLSERRNGRLGKRWTSSSRIA